MNNNVRKNTRLDNFMIAVIVIIYIFMIFVMPFILVYGLYIEDKLRERKLKKTYNSCETLIKNNLYVVTKHQGYNRYYRFNDYDEEDYYEVNEFDFEENKILHLDNCFESYKNKKTNKYYIKLNKLKCEVKDNDWNIVNSNYEIDSIKVLISKLEYNIVDSNIIVVNNQYYVIISLDINNHIKYILYKYQDNKLNIINIFDNEEIIALKRIN